MSDFSFPVPLDGTTTHLHLVKPVDQFEQPLTAFPGPATLSGGDPTIATLTLDTDGLGAIAQGVAIGTATYSFVDAGVTKTVDIVVQAPVLSSFTITADAPQAPAAS